MKDWEEIDLVAPDQVKTKAFVILAARRSEKNLSGKPLEEWRSNRPTILMLHANAGNVVSQAIFFFLTGASFHSSQAFTYHSPKNKKKTLIYSPQ
jgi:hypothetical protein